MLACGCLLLKACQESRGMGSGVCQDPGQLYPAPEQSACKQAWSCWAATSHPLALKPTGGPYQAPSEGVVAGHGIRALMRLHLA